MIFAATWSERVKSLSVISSVSEIGPDLDRAITTWREAALEAPETLYRVSLPFSFSPHFMEARPEIIEQDALKPPTYSRLIADRIPESERLVVPEAGHAVILEKPQEINTALLGFVEKHRGRG